MALVMSPPHTRPPLGWVTAEPPSVAVTVHADEVGPAAWFALHRDRVVRTVWGELAIARDATETPEVRAQALACLVPDRGVVARASAAWVHTGRHSPARVDVLVPARARRPDPHPLRVACEADLRPGDTLTLGSVRVTSVQRTGVDVARLLPVAVAREVLGGLLQVGFDPGAALGMLAPMAGQRGVRDARTLLIELVP
ncbi:hypothetical protein [Cellulomonas soli]|nr:hypothetical protein [Cellulomonas soli]NYI60575.1 hypothetical protein [Cellulomonas soli]